MTLSLRGSAVAVCLFVLTACGGGGGGGGGGDGAGGGGGNSPPPAGSFSYVGAATPADLSSTSVVPPLSGWLLLELGLSGGVNSSIAVAKPSHVSMQKRFDKARQRSIAQASKVTIQEVTTETCGLSGTSEVNDDGVRDDGTGVLVFTFRDCAEGDGTTLNGVMRVTIARFDLARLEPTDYTLNFENIRISSGDDVIEAGGTLRVVLAGTTTTSTRNTVARYLPDNVYVRLQDLVEIQNGLGAAGAVTFRGRFYQSQYGYVDIQTPAPVTFDPSWGYPYDGRMLLTGAAGAARAELRFRAQNALSLVIDTDGDGIAERGLSASPSELLQPISNFLPMADAGPDIAVDEGESVTLDARGNVDWEGVPVQYIWTVLGPGNPVAMVRGPIHTFTPAVPGRYTVQLVVNDGSGRVAIDGMFIQVRDIPGPIAHAGPDRTTIERSTVTLDASATTHPSVALDTLQFAWTRLQAPANSSSPATLTGVQPQVTVDFPGIYEYRLNVTGRGGTSTDTVRIRALAVVGAVTGSFHIDPNTTVAGTTLQMSMGLSPSYTGGPLSASISSDADWLTIDTPNVTIAGPTSVTVRVDLDALASLPNGSHRAGVRIAPSGYAEWTGDFSLYVELPSVQQVSPYVVYTGRPTAVNLLGDQLQVADGRVVVDEVPVSALTRASVTKARAELPALSAGEYTLRATNALGIPRPGARLIVRDPPVYPDHDVAMPGRFIQLEYDMERDVFYGVFQDNSGANFARRFHRQADGTWQFEEIAVPNPLSVTLALGGERLLFTASGCAVYELDAETLQTITSASNPSCYAYDLGLIAALADGEVLVADTEQWSSVYRYPGFSDGNQLLPIIHNAIGIVSHDRSRMLWAELPTISPPNELYVFDALGGPSDATPTSSLVDLHDWETYFIRANLAISGDGSHFMHRGDVYDNSLQYVGSVAPRNIWFVPALSWRGTRAAIYNNETDELTLYDVSNDNNFSSLGVIDTFSEDVVALQLMYHPSDAALFVWGGRTGPGENYRLFVRQLP